MIKQRAVLLFWVSLLIFGITTPGTHAWANGASAETLLKEEAAKLPPSNLLIDGTNPSTLIINSTKEWQTHSVVPVKGQSFRQALRVNVLKGSDPATSVQVLTKANTVPVRRGDVLLFAVSMRCASSSDDSKTGTLSSLLQANRAPWVSVAQNHNPARATWQRIYQHGVAGKDFEAGELQMTFLLGFHRQTLELGGILVFNLGPDVDMRSLPTTPITYVGADPDSFWRKAADERIEKNRKGDLKVIVTTADGRAIPNANVHVQMRRHSFGFGTFFGGPTSLEDSGNGERYRRWTLRLFNRATGPIYWTDHGWASPQGRRASLDLARWLYENRFPTRGHPIVYPQFDKMPRRAAEYAKNPAELRKYILEHVVDVVDATQVYAFDEYDVTNELGEWHDVTNILGIKGVAEWYRTAHERAPKARMAINEYGIFDDGGVNQKKQDAYARLIQSLIDEDAGLDVIGIQAYFYNIMTRPDKALKILDRFAKFGKIIHITEFSIDNPDEQIQAKYIHDFMTVVFSHPSTEAFTQWGFWEGNVIFPRTALIRRDWSLKPAAHAYIDLVFKKWWTNVRGTTDATGSYSTRGFLGEYEITATKDGMEKVVPVLLKKPGETVKVILP